MRYADGPVVEGSVHVAAPPERVWELVSDIHLIASLSGEVRSVEWLDGDGAATVGRAFRGTSFHRAVGEWSTTSRIVSCEEPRAFGWDVEDPQNPSASWRFELTPRDGGTDLRQWARLGPGPSFLCVAIERMPEKEERIVAGRLREWQAGIEANLAAIKERAENP
ncbi:SRPBCC family protein [Pseudonocardia petroleophila]|uniref:SRPBCC family protein n=1 Tax=Pseudonocardia petroleophila TaxID=37331 RepID=A0A7G7MB86_9PSEU|nr:SRPBCC family protein [Pseudonocardia petroleophila]QNG50047.1 SRPBCC family protein [Pseudonocardia petroleophila]